MGEELSRVEDLLATGVEEPVEPMSRVEAILRGEDIKPLSRVEDLLKGYNPPDYDYIDLNVTENGTYTPPSGKMYKKAVVDVPSQAPVLGGISIYSNGTYTPEQGMDGFDNVLVAVPSTTLDNLSVTENGTYTPTGGHGFGVVTVNVAGSGYKTIEHEQVATFADGTDNFLKSLEVAIEPQQDLHGYDSPWVGGAGKNKLPMTLDGMKASNTTGTWSGNTYTINGGTITVSTDDGGNVTVITVNGTFNAATEFRLTNPSNLNNNFYGYVLNGSPTYPNRNIALLVTYIERGAWKGEQFSYNEKDITINQSFATIIFSIYININTSVTDKVFKPMLRLSTETDPTFEPYSNICPISGHTEANVVVSPTTDAEDGTTYTIQFTDGSNPLTVYGGTLDVVSGVMTVTHQIVDLGDATWSYNDLTNVFDTSKIASSVAKPTSSTEVIDLQCSILAKNSSSGITDNPSVDGIAINTLGYIIARYSGMPTSSSDFKTAVTGQKLKFPLATPQTIQLTPTIIKSLQGGNNFFASTGEVIKLQYWGR